MDVFRTVFEIYWSI